MNPGTFSRERWQSRFMSRTFTLLAFIICCSFPATAKAQNELPGSIRLNITQNAEIGGTPSYSISFFVFPWSSLTAPDGTKFGIGPFAGMQTTVPSFEELSERFFGTWNLVEYAVLPTQVESRYEFTLSPFELNDVHHEIPTITSPAIGSTVGSSFDVHWQYPSGINPPTQSISRNAGNLAAHVIFVPDSDPNATFYVLPDRVPDPFQFRAGSVTSLNAFMSPVKLLSGPLHTNYEIYTNFFNYSLPVRVTVIPEPTTAVLLGLGAMMLGCRRR
jgi:hypothetical protein